MSPSIRVTPEGYKGLKKLIDSGYANSISGAIDRFVTEEGVMPEKPEEKIFVKPRASDIDQDKLGFVSAEDRESNFSDAEEEDVVNMLGDSVRNYRYQRDAMRTVFQKCNGDKLKSIRGYTYLEEKSYVKRKNNTHGFNASYYAEALYNDGIQKGWLTISQEAGEFIKQEAERLGIKRFDEDVKEKQKNENLFEVNYCEQKGCQHWRIGNKCTKHGQSIADSFKYVANIHNSSICEVRRQVDKYRLENLLEE